MRTAHMIVVHHLDLNDVANAFVNKERSELQIPVNLDNFNILLEDSTSSDLRPCSISAKKERGVEM